MKIGWQQPQMTFFLNRELGFFFNRELFAMYGGRDFKNILRVFLAY
jgi:hypothetical protein